MMIDVSDSFIFLLLWCKSKIPLFYEKESPWQKQTHSFLSILYIVLGNIGSQKSSGVSQKDADERLHVIVKNGCAKITMKMATYQRWKNKQWTVQCTVQTRAHHLDPGYNIALRKRKGYGGHMERYNDIITIALMSRAYRSNGGNPSSVWL